MTLGLQNGRAASVETWKQRELQRGGGGGGGTLNEPEEAGGRLRHVPMTHFSSLWGGVLRHGGMWYCWLVVRKKGSGHSRMGSVRRDGGGHTDGWGGVAVAQREQEMAAGCVGAQVGSGVTNTARGRSCVGEGSVMRETVVFVFFSLACGILSP